uniref:hypothetical protein n=1 Tax=Candidatus Electronema sp. TaxID=2698783 RepID=UPI004055CC86
MRKNAIIHAAAFGSKLLAFCLLCCFPFFQAAAQDSLPPDLIFSGSGVKINPSPDAVFQAAPEEEPLDSDSLTDDFFDPRTLKILFAETKRVDIYRLTDASLAAIKKVYPFIPDKQYQQLTAMKDKDCKQDSPAWNKVEALLAQLDIFLRKKKNLNVLYFIQDSLADEMKKAELPQFIIESVNELNGTMYVNTDMLTKGFQEQVKRKINSYNSDIIGAADILHMAYHLSENSLLILKGKGLPSDLVDKLAVFKGRYYLNRHKLSGEVRKVLAQFLQTPGQDWVSKAVDIVKKHGQLYQIKSVALSQMLIDQPPEVGRAVKKVNRKGCTLEKLAAMMKDYPALLQNYFRHNQEEILSETGVLRAVHYQPEEPDGKRMRRRGIDKWVAEAVEVLYGENYATKEDYLLAIKKYKPQEQPQEIEPPVLIVPLFQPAKTPPVVDVSKKPLPISLPDVLRWNEPKNYQLEQIELTTKNCGCSAVPENTVYGLYPYWAAEGKPSQVDFSALSRIAYFYLRIDSNNKIGEQRHWQKQYSSFINQARQHKIKVDLVVYKEDWSCLSSRDFCPAGKKAEEMTELIVSQLSPKLDNNLLNHLKPIVSLGNASMPTMGDGIMLYLTELPSDYSCFLSFVKMLRERLLGRPFGSLDAELAGQQEVPADKRLSLLIPDNFFLPTDTEAFAVFQQFLVQAAADPTRYFDDIVVALRDNSATRAQAIRHTIETKFPEQQAALNRKLIPLLTSRCSDQAGIGELQQTMRYAKNNFAGIGLFPVPVITEEQSGEKDEAKAQAACSGFDMYRLVKEEYQSAKPDAVGKVMKQYAPWLCKWACPNRWWIRISFDSLLLFFAVYALLAFYYSPLEDFYRNYSCIFWALAVLTGILIYLTLACDPNYLDKIPDLFIFMLAVLVLTISWSARKRNYP